MAVGNFKFNDQNWRLGGKRSFEGLAGLGGREPPGKISAALLSKFCWTSVLVVQSPKFANFRFLPSRTWIRTPFMPFPLKT